MRADRLKCDIGAEDQAFADIIALQLQEARDDALNRLAICGARDVARLKPLVLARLDVVFHNHRLIAERRKRAMICQDRRMRRAGAKRSPASHR